MPPNPPHHPTLALPGIVPAASALFVPALRKMRRVSMAEVKSQIDTKMAVSSVADGLFTQHHE